MRYALRVVLPGALAAALTLCTALHARAQDPPSERWGVEIGVALNASGGNESLTVFTSSLGLTHLQRQDFRFSLNAAMRYGRSGGEVVARNSRGSMNFDFRPEDAWTPFLFAAAENDPFRKLDLRFNGGAGVKRTFWRDGWSEVSLSGAALYSYENLDIDPGPDPVTRTARWSWRARGRRQLGERSRLEQILFYQPEWRHAGDYLIESLSTLRVGLTESLTLDVAFRYDRDSTPAPGVEPDDWALTTGFRLGTTW